MKQKSTLKIEKVLKALFIVFTVASLCAANAQITLTLGNPNTYIYGLTGNGEILEINSNTAATYRVIKNNSYTGNSPSKANGLAYNAANGLFYYFKRNVGGSNPEFVSFNPKTNTVTILAASTCAAEVHTACISYDGTGYYTIDTQGNVNYYNILTNTWKTITSNIVDQNNNNVTSIIQTQSAGDIAMDGYGNIWVVTSNSTNYGLYKIPYPAPTNTVAKLTVQRIISPATTTPTGNSFAGIAFNATGQIFLATKNDSRLYLLQSSLTLYYIAQFNTSDAGNDLTSQNFPLDVLPVKWLSFDASSDNSKIILNWKVMEYQNKGFYVQYSTDGTNWEEITFIKSKNISESAQDYTYTYIDNSAGIKYYRIKQVDIDGKESFSSIKTIISKQNTIGTLTVWPNPAVNNIIIANNGTGENQFSNAQIYDFSGRMNTQVQLQKGKNNIDINMLAAGTYFVKVYSSNGATYTQKFIKQ